MAVAAVAVAAGLCRHTTAVQSLAAFTLGEARNARTRALCGLRFFLILTDILRYSLTDIFIVKSIY